MTEWHDLENQCQDNASSNIFLGKISAYSPSNYQENLHHINPQFFFCFSAIEHKNEVYSTLQLQNIEADPLSIEYVPSPKKSPAQHYNTALEQFERLSVNKQIPVLNTAPTKYVGINCFVPKQSCPNLQQIAEGDCFYQQKFLDNRDNVSKVRQFGCSIFQLL